MSADIWKTITSHNQLDLQAHYFICICGELGTKAQSFRFRKIHYVSKSR